MSGRERFRPAQRGFNYTREAAPVSPTLMGPCYEDEAGVIHVVITTKAYCGAGSVKASDVVMAVPPERVCPACKDAIDKQARKYRR